MNKARPGDTVVIHFSGMLADGTKFAESDEEEPLRFTIGQNGAIPGLQQAVIGMSAGETKIVVVPADKAYGPCQKALVKVVDREHLPPDVELEVGQRLRVRRSDGSTMPVTVTGISGSSVMLDANHPLAGKDLTFEILLLGIVPRDTSGGTGPESTEARAAPRAHTSRASPSRGGARAPDWAGPCVGADVHVLASCSHGG
jgi:peptidylprolyl isomerase